MYEAHMVKLREHGLFVDHCALIQGFFQDTVPTWKADYKNAGRKIGFAFLDVNEEASYELCFDCIFDLMAERSYIYMDEYYQNYCANFLFERLKARLLTERGIRCTFMRNCAGVGALFLLHPAEMPTTA